MALKSVYNVIQGPIVSSKAYQLNQTLNKLTLRVHPDANKPLIKEALKKLFDVDVRDVKIIVNKGKFKRMGRRVIQGSLKKKAVVTLAEGSSLNLIDQGGAAPVVAGEDKE